MFSVVRCYLYNNAAEFSILFGRKVLINILATADLAAVTVY